MQHIERVDKGKAEQVGGRGQHIADTDLTLLELAVFVFNAALQIAQRHERVGSLGL